MSISIENLDNETWFKISDYDAQRPFFMSLVSDSNHWMFISSNGGLTAGRKNAEYALFPYYTDDKITELAHTTGSKTILQIKDGDAFKTWEPFSVRNANRYSLTRNLFKNRYGNKILFEEINHDLNLTFRYQWNSSNIYGFVRKSELINNSEKNYSIRLLDGVQNILPYGVNSDLQMRSSNLVDAYKRSELVEETGLSTYALSAIIVDKAEPSEALKANVAWSMGLENPKYLLSSLQLDDFRDNLEVDQEKDIKGEKGAYFVISDIKLPSSSNKEWAIVANVNQDHAGVIALNESIKSNPELPSLIEQDIERGTEKLIKLVAGADGLESTSDKFRDARHFSNVLFNIMRGGTFDNNYQIEKQDFTKYIQNANKEVYSRNQSFFESLPVEFSRFDVEELLSEVQDSDLQRLTDEYLPLKFSRRHGDPSRPWNKFSINTHSEVDGSKILDYEGNWRDIFQNWEALVHSYPAFVEGMISKFLNATTFDGYNPYRVTKGGFDWETIEPDDPWSYIGYWGDHQIIYLLKFLEFFNEYDPESLKELFNKNNFVYANVPYKIKPYEDIVANPKDTIEFDLELDQLIREKVAKTGADGALIGSKSQEIYHVNFIEKILATVLAKVSNFIPEGGIWMNTQRPEWNDANNALVGNGVSMVTLYYLRRFLKFFEPLLKGIDLKEIAVSEELAELLASITKVLDDHKKILNGSMRDSVRKDITDGLGKAGSEYRTKVYKENFSGNKEAVQLKEIEDFIQLTLTYLEHSIRVNKRDDNLYHAYNLMSMEGDGISISHLDEMLEGQVAVLSSKYLDAQESLNVLDALRNSALYREDQNSYILYPNKQLPGFLQKNNIPEKQINASELLKIMVAENDFSIVSKDVTGGYHFNGNFKNARDLKVALDELKASEYGALVEKEEQQVLDIFEKVFDHKSFTGRSGTFFAYEGLGSIYWHMVSKLHLAVTEICEKAQEEQADNETMAQLVHHFDEIGEGIGIHKKPEQYGAFPTDPYSHTPGHRGAQQPGMTGQVKEDILVRQRQLGIDIENSALRFDPFLLDKKEFYSEIRHTEMITLDQEKFRLELPSQSLAFTFCQVPVVYHLGTESTVEIEFNDKTSATIKGLQLDKEASTHLFHRTGMIKKLNVTLQDTDLR